MSVSFFYPIFKYLQRGGGTLECGCMGGDTLAPLDSVHIRRCIVWLPVPLPAAFIERARPLLVCDMRHPAACKLVTAAFVPLAVIVEVGRHYTSNKWCVSAPCNSCICQPLRALRAQPSRALLPPLQTQPRTEQEFFLNMMPWHLGVAFSKLVCLEGMQVGLPGHALILPLYIPACL